MHNATTSPEVVVAGHICLDIIPDLPATAATIEPGRLYNIGAAALSTGGAVSGTGLALHTLGVPTALMGKIGEDMFGQAVLGIIREFDARLADGMIVSPGETTSYSIVINPPDIDRTFLHCTGANDTFGPEDIRMDIVREAKIFHFGYPPLMKRFYAESPEAVAALLKPIHDLGITTSLDMAWPEPAAPAGKADWRAILEAALPYVDVFLPSAEETLLMLRRKRFYELTAKGPDWPLHITADDLSDLSDDLIAMGARVVGLKTGERGFYLRTGTGFDSLGRAMPEVDPAWHDREIWAPCYKPEEIVGTTGSGDSTIAGFLTALLNGEGPEQALNDANAVGAFSVESAYALGGLRPWEEVKARLATGWERAALSVDSVGWNQDSAGLWHKSG